MDFINDMVNYATSQKAIAFYLMGICWKIIGIENKISFLFKKEKAIEDEKRELALKEYFLDEFGNDIREINKKSK